MLCSETIAFYVGSEVLIAVVMSDCEEVCLLGYNPCVVRRKPNFGGDLFVRNLC
jgi:hypothetical protein